MAEYLARHAAGEQPGPFIKPLAQLRPAIAAAFRLEIQRSRNRRAGLPVGRHRAVERAGVPAGRRVVMWRGSDG